MKMKAREHFGRRLEGGLNIVTRYRSPGSGPEDRLLDTVDGLGVVHRLPSSMTPPYGREQAFVN